MRGCLDGTNGRKEAEEWKPRYMRFPMQSYTRRKGLPAVEQWKAIKKERIAAANPNATAAHASGRPQRPFSRILPTIQCPQPSPMIARIG